MVNEHTRVIYKPDSQSTDEFIAIVNPEEVCSTNHASDRYQRLNKIRVIVQEVEGGW
jgi:hypothetical protein